MTAEKSRGAGDKSEQSQFSVLSSQSEVSENLISEGFI
jgi:hypothetical protein